MRHLVIALAMALLLSGSAVGAGSGVSAFITNAGITSLSVVTNSATAPAPIAIGALTHGVAVDLQGARVYAASAPGNPGVVYAIDAKSKAVVGSLAFGGGVHSPFGIAVSPDGKRLFMSHVVVRTQGGRARTFSGFLSAANVVANADGTVTMSVVGTVPLMPLSLLGNTTGVATGLWRDGGYRVYVANGSGYITVLDPTKLGIAGQDPVIATVWLDIVHSVSLVGIGVSPDGTRLYAADQAGGKLWVIDATRAGSGSEVLASIGVGKNPFGVAVSPKDGKFVFVANVDSNSVSVIDTTVSGYSVASVAVGENPHGVSVTADGTKAYVVNRGYTTDQPSVSLLTQSGGIWTATTVARGASLNSPVGFGTFTFGVSTIHVKIDVVPPVVNRKAQGTVPVVIFSSDGSDPEYPAFDVHALTVDDFRTLRLSGLSVKFKPNDEPMVNYGDFNGDGLDDVMVHFSMDGAVDTLVASGDSAMLEGQTSDGMSFQGTDSVKFLH